MIVEIDAGNTKIKWRFVCNGRKLGQGALLTGDVADLAEVVEAVGIPHTVRLATVAGSQVRRVLSALALQWGAELSVPQTTAEAAGVRCAYREPANMGVDRWLALIAAFHRVGGACVVVDLGSAITVDVVDSSGQHLGGYIVPGLALMRESLRVGTHDVKVTTAVGATDSLGKSTAEAVNQGALRMVKSLVESVATEMLPSSARVVLTGGDAERLRQVLSSEVEWVPELVLDGLALVA